MKLNIGDNSFDVKVASDDSNRQRGLKGVNGKTIPKGSGLVLKYDKPQKVPITMKDVSFPLDLIFIKDNKVVSSKQAHPGSDDIDIGTEVDHVLEVKLGEGGKIKIGDNVSWTGSIEGNSVQMAEGGIVPEGKAHLLDEDGKVQMNLQDDERVFSRIHTKQLYDLSKKGETATHYRAVGRAMVRMLDKQNTQKQETTGDGG